MARKNLKVFGYDDLCSDFSCRPINLFRAARAYIRLDHAGNNVVFIDGVSNEEEERIKNIASDRYPVRG